MRTTTIFAETHTSERANHVAYRLVILSFCHSVCLSATSELNISETRPDSGMVTMDGLYKLAYGLSIGHTSDDVTWPYDVIMVTSSFFLKMLLLRQFLSELDDTLTQYSQYGVSIWSSRIVDPGLMTSLMTSSVIIIVTTLEQNISETRPDSGMVSTDNLYKLAYGLSIAHARDNVTWPDDVIIVTTWSLNACLFSDSYWRN